MAKKDYIEGWLGRYDYVEVYRDNYTCRKRFKYREEEADADAYFNYLQSLDNEEISIQNQNRIAEQLKRQNELSEQQIKAQNRYNHQTFPRPVAPSTQIVDPEYREWLQFKKETDPEYKKWKRAKEEEEARKRAEEAARVAKLQAEREERERQKQKQLQVEKERQERIIQEEIRPAEEALLNGKPVSDSLRHKTAMHTKNQQVIDILKKSSSLRVLDALSHNSSIKVVDLSLVQNKLKNIREKEARVRAEKAERERRLKEEQARKRREQAEIEENFNTALKWIFGIIAAGVVIGLIIYFAKWIFAVIFVIALIAVFFSN